MGVINFNGPLRYNPANPRYFTDDSGKSIYLTGSHTWGVMQDMWFEGEERENMDYDGFIQMLKDCGHNFLRFWQWMNTKKAPWGDKTTCFDPMPFVRTGPGLAKDGLPRFDLSKCNEDYFHRLRERVEKAGKKGIYVSIMLFEAWGIKWAAPEQDPWDHHPMNPENNVNNVKDNPVLENGRAWDVYSLNCPDVLYWQKEYIKKVIDTVNDLDNVLYEICNEIPNRKEAFDWSDHLTCFIHDYEKSKSKQHPVGITAEGGDQMNDVLFESHADWISPSNGKVYEYRYNPPAADGSKVILNDTDHLWGHGCEIQWIWKSFTRGMNVLFMDPWQPVPGHQDWWMDEDVDKNQRYYFAWDPMRRNLGYARRFALRMDLNKCAPHNELCTSTYCLANTGSEYLCLFPSGSSEGIDLWDAEGEFAVEWFDPTTGKIVKGETIKGGNRYALSSPFKGITALYVNKK